MWGTGGLSKPIWPIPVCFPQTLLDLELRDP
jgi:hypothetical protein